MVYLGELPAVNSATQGFGLYFKGNSKALKILNRGQADQENRVVFRNFPETLLWRVGWRESRRLRNGAEVVRLSCCLFRWEIGRCGKGNHRINEGRDYVPFDCLSCMGFTVHTCKWMNEWMKHFHTAHLETHGGRGLYVLLIQNSNLDRHHYLRTLLSQDWHCNKNCIGFLWCDRNTNSHT